MEEKKNTGLIIVIVILLIAVLGLGGYLVYDKVINKTNEPNVEENNDVQSGNQIKEISINDKLITSLKYPMDNFDYIVYKERWDYKNITVNDLSRDSMMLNASYISQPIIRDKGEEESIVYLASSIESSFKSVYGPDINYYNGDLNEFYCGDRKIYKYKESNDTYVGDINCGGDSLDNIDRISKTYKALKDDSNIYVYQYVRSILIEPKDENDLDKGSIVYLLDHNDNKTTTTFEVKNYKNEIYKMMDEGKVDTYKWTFKKQSDGNYYFYSGAWEN